MVSLSDLLPTSASNRFQQAEQDKLATVAAQMQNDYSRQADPMRLQALVLGNQSTQLNNDFYQEANPMRLQALGLGNTSTQQSIDQSKQLFPLELEGKRLNNTSAQENIYTSQNNRRISNSREARAQQAMSAEMRAEAMDTVYNIVGAGRRVPDEQKPELYNRLVAQVKQFQPHLSPYLASDTGYNADEFAAVEAMLASQTPDISGKDLKAVVDPETGQSIYVTAKEAVNQRVAPRQPSTVVSTGSTGQQVLIKGQGKTIENLNKNYAETSKTFDLFDQMESILPQTATGFGEREKNTLRNFANTLGIKVNDRQLSSLNQFDSTQFQLGLQGLQSFKGPTTDFELGQILNSLPSSAKPEIANAYMILGAKNILERQRARTLAMTDVLQEATKNDQVISVAAAEQLASQMVNPQVPLKSSQQLFSEAQQLLNPQPAAPARTGRQQQGSGLLTPEEQLELQQLQQEFEGSGQ